MIIKRTSSSVSVNMTSDESVRLLCAVSVWDHGLEYGMSASELGVSRSGLDGLTTALRAASRGDVHERVDLGVADPALVVVSSVSGRVSLELSFAAAVLVRKVIELGIRVSGCRVEYFLRSGLARTDVERVVSELTVPDAGVIEVLLLWGDEWLEAPPRALPPRGLRTFVSLYLVIQVSENDGGCREFVVVSAWVSIDEARAEIVRLSSMSIRRERTPGWPQYELRLASLARPPSMPRGGDPVGSLVVDGELFVVGRVVGEDVGLEELFAGSVWVSLEDAVEHAARHNALEGDKIHSPYQVWVTTYRGGTVIPPHRPPKPHPIS
jgi:hypothetical protein